MTFSYHSNIELTTIGTDKRKLDFVRPKDSSEFTFFIVTKRTSTTTLPKRCQLFQLNYDDRKDPTLKCCMKRGRLDMVWFDLNGKKQRASMENIPLPKCTVTYGWLIHSSSEWGVRLQLFEIDEFEGIKLIYENACERALLNQLEKYTIWLNQNQHGNCCSDTNILYFNMSWEILDQMTCHEMVLNNPCIFAEDSRMKELKNIVSESIDACDVEYLIKKDRSNFNELTIKRRSFEMIDGRNMLLKQSTVIKNQNGVEIVNRIRLQDA